MPDRLPPNQRLFAKEKWPVLGVGKPPVFDPQTWKLVVNGLVESPLELNWEQFQALPQTKIIADMHCVTRWSIYDMEWEGVDFYSLLALAKPKPEAISVRFKAWDDIGYTTSIRLNHEHKLFIPEQVHTGDVHDELGYIGVKKLQPTGQEIVLDQAILATRNGGASLSPEHGAPVRMIIPRLYAWKGCKWVNEITFMDTHEVGFWEKLGYSDTADIYLEDRTEKPDAQKKKAEIYRQQRGLG